MKLLILLAKALQALVADELLQYLRSHAQARRKRRTSLRTAAASDRVMAGGAHLLEIALERLERTGLEAWGIRLLFRLRKCAAGAGG